jgi:hypothetical protein
MKVIELEIQLNLNVEPASQPLTYSMLSDPTLSRSGKYKNPFFTSDVDYNKVEFNEKYVPYNRIVEIFFDRNKFMQFFNSYATATSVASTASSIASGVAESNVLKMLSLLLPARYSVYPNVSSSMAESFGSTGFGQITNQLSQLNPLKIQQRQYSYLTVGGAKSTVFRVIWLNDIANSTKYRELLELIKKYYISSLIPNANLINEYKKLADLASKINKATLQVKVDDLTPPEQARDVVSIKQRQKVFSTFLTALGLFQVFIAANPIVAGNSEITLEQEAELQKLVTSMTTLELVIEDKTDALFTFLMREVTPAFKAAENIGNILEIRDKFLNKGRIDINYENNLLPKYVNYLKQHAPFMELITKIKEYTTKYISGNDALQSLIIKYAQGYDESLDMMRLVYTVYKTILNNGDIDSAISKSKKPNPLSVMSSSELQSIASTNLIYTSVERNIADIEVLVDVITGEINDSNKSQIACKLKDEVLGNSFENMWYGSTQSGLLATGTRISASLLADVNKSAPAPTAPAVAQPVVGKGRKKGGRKKTRHVKWVIKRRKTRKIRKIPR